MADFMIRFLLCNIFISIITGILVMAKRLLKNNLTHRAQYQLWFLFLGLLAIPFITALRIPFPFLFSWAGKFQNPSPSLAIALGEESDIPALSPSAGWINDFGVSVSQKAPSIVGIILCLIWITGIAAMTVLVSKSMLRFHAIKNSALPLQSQTVHRLYHSCLKEMNITRNIPIYSAVFLSSPVIAGFLRPSIYLPVHLISGSSAKEIRYMLLHELQHYKHKDALANYLMNAARVIYWFNPFVWFALREMKNDREIACDASVLNMLKEEAYEDYGNTLINFAEKVSLNPFPFAAGIGGSMALMKKRVINIACYRPASFRKKLCSLLSYMTAALLLSGFIPALSIQAADKSYYFLNEHSENISYIDLSSYFGENTGSFVLYDAAQDSWQIYNKEYAAARICPASTYKIYIALSGLESGIISPGQSLIRWNGQHNIIDVWNQDQTLTSAMQNSVNWYFQSIDQQAGMTAVKKFIRQTGYGNQNAEGGPDTYWINSSLKISPVEQVEMLKKLYYNQFGFSPENIEAVKNSICLYESDDGSLYGKTGTEQINGTNVSGWFIGYVEKEGRPYFFATNIQKGASATGACAAELTFSILSSVHLWNTDISVFNAASPAAKSAYSRTMPGVT